MGARCLVWRQGQGASADGTLVTTPVSFHCHCRQNSGGPGAGQRGMHSSAWGMQEALGKCRHLPSGASPGLGWGHAGRHSAQCGRRCTPRASALLSRAARVQGWASVGGSRTSWPCWGRQWPALWPGGEIPWDFEAPLAQTQGMMTGAFLVGGPVLSPCGQKRFGVEAAAWAGIWVEKPLKAVLGMPSFLWLESPSPAPGIRFPGLQKSASVTGGDGGHAGWPTGQGTAPQSASLSPALESAPCPHCPPRQCAEASLPTPWNKAENLSVPAAICWDGSGRGCAFRV